MSFLKNKSLVMVALGMLFLSSSAYGYLEEHLQRLNECHWNKIPNCPLQGVDLSRLGVGQTLMINLDYPNLDNANLNGVHFSGGVHIIGGSMRGVKCKGAQFNNSTFENVKFTDIKECEGVNFNDTSFSGDEMEISGNFEGGTYNYYSWFPEGFVPEDHGLSYSEKSIYYY